MKVSNFYKDSKIYQPIFNDSHVFVVLLDKFNTTPHLLFEDGLIYNNLKNDTKFNISDKFYFNSH